MICIDEKKCIGCGQCVDICPGNLLAIKNSRATCRDVRDCWGCCACVKICPVKATAYIHVDTLRKIPAMIEYRDRVAKELGIKLIVHTNWEAVKSGASPALGRLECCCLLKTEGLKQVVKQYGFDGLIVGVRRDEEGSRSKERVFSERNESDAWDYTNQPPELWKQFKTDFPKGHQRTSANEPDALKTTKTPTPCKNFARLHVR